MNDKQTAKTLVELQETSEYKSLQELSDKELKELRKVVGKTGIQPNYFYADIIREYVRRKGWDIIDTKNGYRIKQNMLYKKK